MKSSPDNEGVGSPMPQSTDSKNNHRIKNPSYLATSVTTKWKIDVVSKPGCERNVPASLKVCNGLCEVRADKVRLKLDTEKFSATYSHQRISCKISINLNCIKNGCKE